jgi:hypothetical protein
MKFILFLFLLIFNQNIFAAASIHYDTLPIGERGFLQGGAFIARSDDASASWYNPAGLVMHEVDSVSASGSIFALASSERSDGNTFNDFITIPSFVGSIGHIYPNLVWAFSIVSPANAISEVNSYSTGNYTSDGLEYKDMKVFDRSSISRHTLAPGISFATSLNSKLRLGFGARVFNTGVKLDVEQYYISHDSDGSDATNTDNTYGSSFKSTLSAEAYNLRLELGAQYDLTSKLTIGAFARMLDISLATPAVSFNVAASSMGKDQARAETLFIGTDGKFNYKYPTELMFGAAWSDENFDVELAVKYYSAINAFNMTEGLEGEVTTFTTAADSSSTTSSSRIVSYPSTKKSAESVVNISVGGSYKLTDKFLLQGGVFTDGDPDQVSNNIGGTLGVTMFNNNSTSSFGLIYVQGSGEETVTAPFSGSTTVKSSNSILGLNISGSVYF